MTTLKQLRQGVELEEGLRHQIIGGATLIAGIMGALLVTLEMRQTTVLI